MTQAQLKDYYNILGIPVSATSQDIKKAYRHLALKYHPDTNAGAFAEIKFREIHEAYQTLSDPSRRSKYDDERWLAGMGNRARDKEIITPYWIFKEAQRLRRHMLSVDTYRMSHSALHDYIFLLLSDSHMAVLQQANDSSVNNGIVHEILASTKGLRYEYMQDVAARLAQLAGADNALQQRIYEQMKQGHRLATWERYRPVVILIVTIVLCLLMFWWAAK